MKLDAPINPKACNDKHRFCVVRIINTDRNHYRLVETWPCHEKAQRACRVLQDHNDKRNGSETYGVLIRDAVIS